MKFYRSVLTHLFTGAVLAVVSATAFAQETTLKRDLDTAFDRYEVTQIRLPESAVENGSFSLTVPAGGQNATLRLERHDLRAQDFIAEDTGPMGRTPLEMGVINTFKGSVDGVAGSEVRVSIGRDGIEGFFGTESGRFFIEPASKYSESAGPGLAVIYRAEDSKNGSDFWCESDIPSKIEYGKTLAASSSAEAVASLRRIDLATDADQAYVNIFGSAANANAEILSILNMVEGAYASELNLTIRVTFMHTWSVADPYNGANTSQMLDAFRIHWNANYSVFNYPRTAAHLFSGKSTAQSQGIAYLSVMCSNSSFAYGISGYISWAPGKYLISAHELGHNLGANHAEAAQGCSNTLMNSTLSGSTPVSFCPYSRNEITNFVSAYGQCMASVSSPRFDFDGDRRADIALFRPETGAWYLNRSQAGFEAFTFGAAGDAVVAEDYDGDGKADAAIFREGQWWMIRSGTNTIDVRSFGMAGDVPVPADFDGDGKADLAVFRPSNGVWYRLFSSTGSFTGAPFGQAGDIPMPGDYSGDGKADLSVFRPGGGVWFRLNSGNGNVVITQFGMLGDKPLTGDFDADGRLDVAVWRPATGAWYVLRSSNGSFYATTFGIASDVPAPADYDGDGKTDIAVYRPADGIWHRLNSSNGAYNAMQFGLPSDVPVQAR
ncbi:MAG: VCBS repeat-containing protein [Acidobacteria bacterium]|nr:VCBS repeat-containing protein [Acidobacteriota bacterium]